MASATKPMKVVVVGAGAIGGWIAYGLAQAGHSVGVIARGPHLAAIRAHGLKLVDHVEQIERAPAVVDADDDPQRLAVRFGAPDLLIIGLKANAIEPMLEHLVPLLSPQTIVMPAINGLPWWYFQHHGGVYDGAVIRAVDPHGALAGTIDSTMLLGCVVHAAAEVRAPGEVHHTGGKRLIIGEIDRNLANPATERVAAVALALHAAGMEPVVSEDIRAAVWGKLVGNTSFNPVAALANARMGAILSDEGLLNIIRPMLAEGMAVARAYGIDVGMTPDARIDLARSLGNAKISMHQDFDAGRPPEIDAIVGAVIELAGWASVPVPTIATIEALVRARARNLGLV